MYRKENKLLFSTIRFLSLALLIVGLGACDDDEGEEMNPDPMGTITASDQTISQNMIMVSRVDMEEDGWIVVHKKTADGVEVPDIISEPVQLTAGTNNDVMIPLMAEKSISGDPVTLEDGEELVLMLHTDDGQLGEYEFDGSNGLDAPLLDEDGDPIVTSVMITMPDVTVADQPVSGNTVTIPMVKAAVDGWIVIHNDDGTGNITLPGIIGKTKVNAGVNEDVEIELDGSINYVAGQKLFAMLHVDDPADDEYTFPDNGDSPEIFGFSESNVVVKPFTVEAQTGSIAAEDQMISQNTIMVNSITTNAKGWVVVHKMNPLGGIDVPDIVSDPVALEAGTNENVMIPLLNKKSISGDMVSYTDGETLVLMLHTDNGTVGEYEFDGENGLDAPLTADGVPVVMPVEISSPGFSIGDQAVVNNTVTFHSVNAAVDGWIVVHNQNEDGSIMLPEVIGKTKVSAGLNEEVVVTLDEANTYETGQSLYPMLHIEDPMDDAYTFPEDQTQDGPEVFGYDGEDAVILVNKITVL